jgi:hypothetical protein
MPPHHPGIPTERILAILWIARKPNLLGRCYAQAAVVMASHNRLAADNIG